MSNNKKNSGKVEDSKFTLRILEDEIKSLQRSLSHMKEDTNTILNEIKKLKEYFLK